jgi:hypothetical protein
MAEGFGVAAWLNGSRYGGEGLGVEMGGGEGRVEVGRVAQMKSGHEIWAVFSYFEAEKKCFVRVELVLPQGARFEGAEETEAVLSVPNFSAVEVETDGEAGDGVMRFGRKVEQAEPEFFRAF